MDLYGVSTTLIQLITGCSRATAYRYKSHPENVPHCEMALLTMILEGDLGQIDRNWRGWTVRNGQLCTPTGEGLTPGEVQAIPFYKQLISHYQSEQRLPRQANLLTDKWEVAPDYDVVSGS